MAVTYEWRGPLHNVELNELHAEAFETRVFDETEWNWVDHVHRHSFGVGRRSGREPPDRVCERSLGRPGSRLAPGHDGRQARTSPRRRHGPRSHGRRTGETGRMRVAARRLRRASTSLLPRRLRVQTDRRRAHRLVSPRHGRVPGGRTTSLQADPGFANVAWEPGVYRGFLPATSRCALAPMMLFSCSTARAAYRMFSWPRDSSHRSQSSQPAPSMPNSPSNCKPASSTSARSSSG